MVLSRLYCQIYIIPLSNSQSISRPKILGNGKVKNVIRPFNIHNDAQYTGQPYQIFEFKQTRTPLIWHLGVAKAMLVSGINISLVYGCPPEKPLKNFVCAYLNLVFQIIK